MNYKRTITAEQYKEYGKLIEGMCNSRSCFSAGNDQPHIHTINNQIVNLEIGDYVVKDGEYYYIFKPDSFEKLYEAVEDKGKHIWETLDCPACKKGTLALAGDDYRCDVCCIHFHLFPGDLQRIEEKTLSKQTAVLYLQYASDYLKIAIMTTEREDTQVAYINQEGQFHLCVNPNVEAVLEKWLKSENHAICSNEAAICGHVFSLSKEGDLHINVSHGFFSASSGVYSFKRMHSLTGDCGFIKRYLTKHTRVITYG